MNANVFAILSTEEAEFHSCNNLHKNTKRVGDFFKFFLYLCPHKCLKRKNCVTEMRVLLQ